MNIWKIEHANKTPQGAKIAICLSSSESRGIILQPGEFVLSQEQNTASLDSQKRRGFVNVALFDNSIHNFPLGIVYNTAVLTNIPASITTSEPVSKEDSQEFLDKLQEAQKDAADYINKNKE